jgi:hypothetical protein
VRYLLPLALLLLVPIVLAPAGSAKPQPVRNFEFCVQNATTLTPTPACSQFGTSSSFAGATNGAKVQVTIINDGSSTDTIGSANVVVPSQLRIDTTAGTPAPSANVSVAGQTVQIRSVTIRPGRSFVATFFVDTACSGTGLAWSAQANTSSGFTGTETFAYQSALSTGTSTDLATGCHLGFAAQPTDTEIGQPIKDGGGSVGGDVKVALYQGATGTTPMTTCPYGTGNCSVTVSVAPTPATFGGTKTKSMQTDGGIGGLAAAFGDLSITDSTASLPETFGFSASGDASLAPSVSSNSFVIALYAAHCSPSCSLTQKNLPGFGGDVDSFADLTGATGFTFMTLSPYSLTATPDGCQNRKDLGVAGFAETDGRAPGGTMTIRYYVNMNAIKARYGKNVGAQFIPICAGGKPVIDGAAKNCVELEGAGGSAHGWIGDSLTAQKFDGGSSHHAVCAADGFYWGILGSFQDNIPAGNPVVSAWGSQTINNVTYRYFDITVPPEWDWRSGP